MAHRVDAAMDQVKDASLDSPSDRSRFYSGVQKLPARDDPVLVLGESGQ